MQDARRKFDPNLEGLPKEEWALRLADVANEHGFFEKLGDRHLAAHVRRSDTLFVTFETLQGMHELTHTSEPFGWEMVRLAGWSHLCLASDGDTWFRDTMVFDLFDRLADEGFFDEFENILFFGAGSCGYAAAAFSVAAPGAQVLVIQPQATLDPRITEWDKRFPEMRRTDFSYRYGYAPDMLDACSQAFVLYDPAESLDAMHAALFSRPGVIKLQMRHMGDTLQVDLIEMEILQSLLVQAAQGQLTELSFAQALRARRSHPPYLRRLMALLSANDREDLVYMLARNVTSRMKAPRFRRRLAEIEAHRLAQASKG